MSTTQYTSALFSPERMETRCKIFFDFSLPAIDKAARQHQLFHVVSYSEELPERYKSHLFDAASTYDWLRLDLQTPTNREDQALEEIAKRELRPGTIFATYRLDDDDLLGQSYFDSLGRYLKQPFVGSFISFSSGIQAIFDGSSFVDPRFEHRPKIAIGLARICEYRQDLNLNQPPRSSHTKSDLVAPVVLDGRSLQFLHTLHPRQDSLLTGKQGSLANHLRNHYKLPDALGDQSLETYFPNVDFTKGSSDTRLRLSFGDKENNPSSIAGWAEQFAREVKLLRGRINWFR